MKLRDIYANYHKYTYAQLLKEFPGIDWTMMFWVSGCPSFQRISVQEFGNNKTTEPVTLVPWFFYMLSTVIS